MPSAFIYSHRTLFFLYFTVIIGGVYFGDFRVLVGDFDSVFPVSSISNCYFSISKFISLIAKSYNFTHKSCICENYKFNSRFDNPFVVVVVCCKY